MKFTLVALCLSFSLPVWAQSCPMKGVYVQVLGSGGPELSEQRASSSYLLWDSGKPQVLVDFGTGAANNLGLAQVDIAKVNYLLLSHLHTDHSADFAALIKASYFVDKTTDLQLYGPSGSQIFPSVEDFVQHYIGPKGTYSYLQDYVSGESGYQVNVHQITPTEHIQTFKLSGLNISAIDAEHGPVPSLAWRVEVGTKVVTFSGDNGGHSDNLARLAQNSDLLVAHNAVPEGAQGVGARLHMQPSRIGEIAQQAQVEAVLLSHFMSATVDQQAQSQAEIGRSYTGPLLFAKDMQCVKL